MEIKSGTPIIRGPLHKADCPLTKVIQWIPVLLALEAYLTGPDHGRGQGGLGLEA